MSIEDYLELLQKRRCFYQALIELIPLEKEAIQKKNLHNVNLLLTQKKILLNCIDDIEKKITSLTSESRADDPRIHKELLLTKNLISQLLSINHHHQKVLGRWPSSLTKIIPS